MRRTRKYSGFTIVELLVVIVVIGILAAITIVSYSGITSRANVAALQSDLDNASKKLKMYYVLYGSYPTALNASNCPTAPTVDNNYCLNIPVAATQYQATSSTFCITDTKSNTSYYINQDLKPTAGGCSGDWVAGVPAIINIAANPSFEVGTNSCYANTGITMTTSSVNPYVGSNSFILNVPSSTADNFVTCPITVAPSTAYVLSFYARADVSTSFTANVGLQETSGSWRWFCRTSTPTAITTSWARIVMACTSFSDSPAGAQVVFRTSVTTNIPVYFDGVMVTAGTSQPNFADGGSRNWVWNGSAGISTSTGPAY